MKKLLVLTPRYPYPVIGGDRLRIYQQCKELSKYYELTLLSLCESEQEMCMPLPNDGVFKTVERVYLPKWKSYLNCIISLPTKTPLQVAYYRTSKFKTKIEQLIVKHDVVFAHLVRAGDYVKDFPCKKVLEMTDAISMNYERVKSVARTHGFKNLIYSIEQKRLLSYERKVGKRFDLSLLVSEVDRKYLYGGDDDALEKVIVCSNGVDVISLPYSYKTESNVIVFIGNMTTVQNFDAALWFASTVMPLLPTEGNYTFKVIGRITQEKRKELERFPKVEVTGAVDSVTMAARGALVGVCPMRIGAGVQNKILEYMALGLPAVSSTLGFEGILAIRNKEILIANEPEEYVNLIERLANDQNFAKCVSIAGREFVEAKHGWEAMLSPMVKRIENMLS